MAHIFFKNQFRDRNYKFPTLSGYCSTLLLWKTTTSFFFACHVPVYLVINPAKVFSQTYAIQEAQNEIDLTSIYLYVRKVLVIYGAYVYVFCKQIHNFENVNNNHGSIHLLISFPEEETFFHFKNALFQSALAS